MALCSRYVQCSCRSIISMTWDFVCEGKPIPMEDLLSQTLGHEICTVSFHKPCRVFWCSLNWENHWSTDCYCSKVCRTGCSLHWRYLSSGLNFGSSYLCDHGPSVFMSPDYKMRELCSMTVFQVVQGINNFKNISTVLFFSAMQLKVQSLIKSIIQSSLV